MAFGNLIQPTDSHVYHGRFELSDSRRRRAELFVQFN